MKRLAFWLPPLLWMAVILGLSSDQLSAANTGRLLGPLLQWLLPGAGPAQIDAVHGALRKSAHVLEYAILVGLWFRALRRERGLAPRPAAWIAFLVAVGWAAVDEARQALAPARTASALDVAIDAGGALAAALVGRHGWRRASEVATGGLLWLAAAGGAAAIAINVLSGAGSGVLWVTVPAAALVLLVRRAGARRRSPVRLSGGDRGCRAGRRRTG